jgi:hypothetical protein
VNLEERSIEELPDRCENCGARLTDAEKQIALESGASVVLCTTCAGEQVALADEAESEAEY